MTKMGMASMLRNALISARDYMDKEDKEFDEKMKPWLSSSGVKSPADECQIGSRDQRDYQHRQRV